jgi:hypothetical protein
MSRYTTVEKWIDVEVDLEDFDDEDIIDEMERRNLNMRGECGDELINKIFHARRQGQPYEHLLDQFLYEKTGRAI